MTLRFDLKRTRALLIYSLFSLVALLLLTVANIRNESYLHTVGIIICFHIVFSLIALKYVNRIIFNISGLFLLIAFILHYGQFILLLLKDYTFFKRNFITRYPVDIYSVAVEKCLLITTFLTIGLLIGGSIKKSGKVKSFYNQADESNKCKVIGTILTIILIPLRMYIDISRMIISIQSGYVNSLHEVNINNIFIVFSRLSTVAIVILIYGLEKGSKARRAIYSLYALYLVIMMLSGSRLSFIISLLILTMCYIRFEKLTVSWKTVIIISLAIFFVVSIMATAREYRYYYLGNNASFEALLQVFRKKILEENVILQEIEELGQSFYTCSAAVDYVERYGYGFGKSYYLGILTIFPNISGIINKLDVMSSYTRTMQQAGITADYVNIGGSFIGEMIFNFRYIFPLFAFVVGLLISYFSNRFEERLGNNRVDYSLVYAICVLMSLMEWSRDTFSASVRYWFWGCILFYISEKIYIMSANIFKE